MQWKYTEPLWFGPLTSVLFYSLFLVIHKTKLMKKSSSVWTCAHFLLYALSVGVAGRSAFGHCGVNTNQVLLRNLSKLKIKGGAWGETIGDS